MIEQIVAKVIGVLSGALLALVFDPPRSRTGFMRRTVVAVVAGYIFGHVVLHLLEWPETSENMIAAWCISSASSWYIMGKARKLIDAYTKE
jgi:hypothetical protein